MVVWNEPVRFGWDDGNKDKHGYKHRVTRAESEEVFFGPHKQLRKRAGQ